MDRTVPSTASDEIELYLRTVYSLLRSTVEVQIRTLEEVHAGMNSSLHPDARKSSPDTSALIYSLLRLPDCMPKVRSVVLGQSAEVFEQGGFAKIESWKPVQARARRRRCLFNGKDTLACFISSRSDIEDLLPVLTAYQIEWNKLHFLLKDYPLDLIEQAGSHNALAFKQLSTRLSLTVEDLERLETVWGEGFVSILKQIREHPCSMGVRLLSGSLSEYWRATRAWWDHIEDKFPAILDRPVYFVSGNTHSMPNLLTGFALQQEAELVAYLENSDNTEMQEEWVDICEQKTLSSRENFLYYLLKKYQQTRKGKHLEKEQSQAETAAGITRVLPLHSFDLEAQLVELAKLDAHQLDPRLQDINGGDWTFLQQSDALIINIDYPLGLTAYNVLAKVAEHTGSILGVYVMGKAATLNGVRGDVMIPNVVQDEHSQNTYLFQNAFTGADVARYLTFGTVLDNQKAVTVLGTFLQNARVMDVVYREGYTDIEMEAGPYLSAVYEMYRPKRHPVNEIVNLYGVPFDLGILHYASDTPLSKGKNLGAGTLSYFGMDSTYATTIAILRRILQLEQKRMLRKNVK